MAALTGNSIGSSYQALLKTTDNGAIDATLKNMTDGLGNATPLSMANNYVQLQAPTIELIESTGGTNLMMIDATQTYFEGNVDFTNATVTGLGGGSPGLIAGTASTNGPIYQSMKSSSAVSNNPAVSNAGGNIVLGELAQATTTNGGWAASNIVIGTQASATQAASITIGTQSSTVERGLAIGFIARANSLESVAIGNDSTGAAYQAVSIGKLSVANNTGGVALGRNVTTMWDDATTVNQLAIQNYASLNFADDAAAAAGNVPLGGVYHTSGTLKVRIV